MPLLHYRDKTTGQMIPIVGSGVGVTDHGALEGLGDNDHDQYLPRNGSRPMTGTLTTPDLVISGESPEPGLVWTADDSLGSGSWQEPSSLVVAETSDPVLINWFDNAAEGWVKYYGDGTMVWEEMSSPSMPGVLTCTGDVWAEWQFGSPMVYEPGALYRVTVRARMDAGGRLSFGFQGYGPSTPPLVVDITGGTSDTDPHWCGKNIAAGDAAWEDDVLKPGEWFSRTGYISSKSDGIAENLPPMLEPPPNWPPECASSESAVIMALGVHQWRPVFHATGGKVWVDAIEIHRLDRSLELPDGIRASDVYAQSVAATTVTTENLVIPPSTEGYVLTAVNEAGGSEWQYPPILVTEGEPRGNLLTKNQESLETDLTGWGQPWQSTLSISTMLEHSSIRIATTTISNGSGQTPTHTSQGTPVPAAANQEFTASALYTGGNAGGQILLDFRDAAGVRLTTYSSIVTPAQAAEAVRISVTGIAPANTAAVSVLLQAVNSAATVGHHANFDDIYLWEGTGPSDAPENPLTVNLGTVAGRQSGMAYVISSGTPITATVATTRVPGSKAIQFTLAESAMVTGRFSGYLYQTANSTATVNASVGVEDGAGTYLYTDDWAAASASAFMGCSSLRSSTGGATVAPVYGVWKRYLPPGSYTMFVRAWLSTVDAASTKQIGYGTLEVEIDPGMTYLTGQRP